MKQEPSGQQMLVLLSERAQRPRLFAWVVLGAALVGLASNASAQIASLPAPRDPDLHNVVSAGASGGVFLGRDARFLGFAVDYGRRLEGPWSVGVSLAYDREWDRTKETTVATDTLNAVVVVNYTVRFLTLTTGLAKGFADTGRPGGAWKTVNGDWGTGIILGASLPSLPGTRRMTITVSGGWEYNLSAREHDITFDAGIGYAF